MRRCRVLPYFSSPLFVGARLLLLTLALAALSCGKSDEDNGSSNDGASNNGATAPVDVTEVRIWPTVVNVQAGQVVPLLATDQGPFLEIPVQWSVDDESVASIEIVSGGLARLHGKAPGTVSVTATAENGVTATRELTVSDLALDDETIALVGEAVQGMILAEQVRPARTVAPRRVVVDATLVDALIADLGASVSTLAVAVDPGVFDREPVTVAASDLSFGAREHMGALIGPTCDPLLEFGLHRYLDELQETVDVSLLREGLQGLCFIPEGPTAGGVYLTDDYAFKPPQELARGEGLTNGPQFVLQLGDDPVAVVRGSNVESLDSYLTSNYGTDPYSIGARVEPIVQALMRRRGFELTAPARAGVGMAYGLHLGYGFHDEVPDTWAAWSVALRRAHECPECVQELGLPARAGAVHLCLSENGSAVPDITVTVYDTDGKPLRGARVAHMRKNEPETQDELRLFREGDGSTAVTDSEGKATFDGDSSSWDLWLTEAEGATEWASPQDTERGTLTLAADAPHLFGGSPLAAGTTIDVSRLTGNVSIEYDFDCEARVLHSKTGIWLGCDDGPYLDPDPDGCGFGSVEAEQ